jgi:hypothetical protein
MENELDMAALVRAGDYDRFLAIQLAPAAARQALYTAALLSIELSHIAETVSEPMLGHIRLAWWREALEEIEAGKTPRKHPLVEALAALHRAHPGVMQWLQPMVAGRAADLDAELLSTEEGWQTYLDQTAGALHRSWAKILQPGQVQNAIAQTARGYAMVGLVRAIPYQAAQKFRRFPPSRLPSLEPGAALQMHVQSILAEASPMLAASDLPRVLLPLKGLARLARLQAQRLQKSGANPYDFRDAPLKKVLLILRLKLANF